MYWSQFVGISTSMISWFPIQGISCGGRAQPQGFIWSTGGVIGHWSWAQLWVMVGCRCLRDKIIQIYIYIWLKLIIYTVMQQVDIPEGYTSINKRYHHISPHISWCPLDFNLSKVEGLATEDYANYVNMLRILKEEFTQCLSWGAGELGSWGRW